MLSTQSNGSAVISNNEADKRCSSKNPKGVLARVVWFYMVGNATALLISLGGIVVVLHQIGLLMSPVSMSIIILVGVITIVVWDYELFRNTRSPLLEEWSNEHLEPTPVKPGRIP
jgi:hypothetical protein